MRMVVLLESMCTDEIRMRCMARACLNDPLVMQTAKGHLQLKAPFQRRLWKKSLSRDGLLAALNGVRAPGVSYCCTRAGLTRNLRPRRLNGSF